MPIPPDTRAPGDAGHVADHNNIADELTALVAADAAETARALAAEAILAPKASPALTGTPTAPTATALTGTTQVATTAYADSAVTAEANRATAAEALKAPLASPALTGSPTAPTQTAGDSSTKLATTAFAAAAVAAARPLATEATYFVSAGASASDSNDGLSVKTAKATIAGALAATGSAAAKIIVGYGTFTIAAADGNGNAVTLPNANMILQGQGADRTVINVSTTVTWGILAQAAYCEVRDLCVQAVTGGTVTYGAGVDTPSSPGSAEHCNFRDILIQPTTGTITNCFAVAPTHTGASNIDVAETTFLRCIAVGAANANYLLGNGTSGNILNTTLTDCYSSSAAYGVYATGTTFTWKGGTAQKSSTADFCLSQTKRADIQGFRSETSTAFLVSPAVGGHNSVAVRDVIWQGNSNGSLGPVQSSDGVFINYAQGGTLTLDNVQIQSAISSGVVPCFILASGGSGTAPLAVVASGLAAEALPHQLFSIASGKPCTVTLMGYVRLSNTTGVAVTGVPPVNHLTLKPYGALFTFNGTARQVMTPGAHPKVYSPVAFGAAGDGTTDDTTAVLAAFTAASTAKGIVDLGAGTFLTSSAIPAYTGMRVRGSNQQGPAAAGGSIVNNTSDLFSFTGTISDVKISECGLKATAGHVFNAGTATLAQVRIEGCTITQTAAGKSIWSQTGGAFIDCLVGDNSSLIASPAATVSPWTMTGMAGVVNSVAFRRMRCTMNGNGASVPFFKIDPGSTAGWNQEIKFEHITWEVCSGGGIYMTGCVDVTIDSCSNWDIASTRVDAASGTTSGSAVVTDTHAVSGDVGSTVTGTGVPAGTTILSVVAGTSFTMSQNATATGSVSVTVGGLLANFYSFKQSTAGYPSRSVQVRGGRAGGLSTTGSGFSDFFADSNSTNILLESFGSWGTAPVISSPSGQTTVINGTVASGGPTNTIPGVSPVAPDIQLFTSVGAATWTKPAGAVTTDVFILSGGSGGGSGRRGAAGTIRCGGGGGAAGALVSRKFAAADLTSTVTVTVGDGGAGGAAVTADSTSGNNGSFGSISSFGTYLAGPLGSTGFGGSATSGAGGLGPFGVAAAAGSGGSASPTGGPGVGVNNGTLGPSGGPSGGGITSADVPGAGAAGAYCYPGGTAGSTAGAAGAVDSTTPTSGTSSGVKGTPGGSPGAGAASITTVAQSGAAAYANSGAGGSGGGASLNGNNSGAGGKGGSGFVLVVSFFQ